ncbi:type II toxin-antitoxin system prevent-host-death family antitoxin [candidate division KSB1 bacterium]|nr:type II toxin-antitoxin system prevent-host-death family antitoxin [candidate division KSB1 bacterium]
MCSIDIRNITPLTDFRNNIKKYLNEIRVHKKPIILTQHGKSAAVIMDAEKYQEMQDQIEFMRKVALGLEDYREGRIVPAETVFSEIDQIIN